MNGEVAVRIQGRFSNGSHTMTIDTEQSRYELTENESGRMVAEVRSSVALMAAARLLSGESYDALMHARGSK